MSDLNPEASPKPQNLLSLGEIRIYGLFDLDNVRLPFTDSGTTLVHGTNGAGKSTVLRIIAGMLSNELSVLDEEPFTKAVIEFSNNSFSTIYRKERRWSEVDSDQHQTNGRFGLDPKEDPAFALFLRTRTSYELVDNEIIDPDTGIELSISRVRDLVQQWRNISKLRNSSENLVPISSRVGSASKIADIVSFKRPTSGRQLTRPCTLVATDRLSVRMLYRAQRKPGLAIQEVAKDLRNRILEAREFARSRAAEIDADFFERVLVHIETSTQDAVIDRGSLESRLRDLHTRLYDNALTTSQIKIPDSNRVLAKEKVVQAIFDIHLADLLKKAESAYDALQRLELFSKIINARLVDKKLKLSAEDGFVVLRGENPIPLDGLSSGEQHLMVLFHSLIFKTQAGGICIIDEPEISLNVDWQEHFIDDIESVAKVSPQQFIVATHSPQIVGNRHELLREILPLREIETRNG